MNDENEDEEEKCSEEEDEETAAESSADEKHHTDDKSWRDKEEPVCLRIIFITVLILYNNTWKQIRYY